MNHNIDLIVVKSQNGEYAGWAEMYKGVLVKDQETGEYYVYAIERCNPQNRYYKIARSDLSVGVTNDTLYIKIEKNQWGDTEKGDPKFTDKRIECIEGEKGLPDDPNLLKILGLVATTNSTLE